MKETMREWGLVHALSDMLWHVISLTTCVSNMLWCAMTYHNMCYIRHVMTCYIIHNMSVKHVMPWHIITCVMLDKLWHVISFTTWVSNMLWYVITYHSMCVMLDMLWHVKSLTTQHIMIYQTGCDM